MQLGLKTLNNREWIKRIGLNLSHNCALGTTFERFHRHGIALFNIVVVFRMWWSFSSEQLESFGGVFALSFFFFFEFL